MAPELRGIVRPVGCCEQPDALLNAMIFDEFGFYSISQGGFNAAASGLVMVQKAPERGIEKTAPGPGHATSVWRTETRGDRSGR